MFVEGRADDTQQAAAAAAALPGTVALAAGFAVNETFGRFHV
jgi:hypothetical protein